MPFLRSTFIAGALALVACSHDSSGPGSSAKSVLFIGNSLTYANDLPATVAGLASSAGIDMNTSDASRGGVALIDYFFDDGMALAAIDRGGWDFVVLQQGPTWPGLCRDTLVLATTMFADRIRAHGGKPALFMPWASETDMQYFDGVRTAYHEAASAAKALFMPVGEAWRIAFLNDPGLPLYDTDDYHPAPLGTYLAALVIYEQITGKDARQLPATAIVGGAHLNASEERVRLLQNAAHEANQGSVSSGAGPTQARLVAAATC